MAAAIFQTLVRSAVTIAFALASHEASDFKHRHIPITLSYVPFNFTPMGGQFDFVCLSARTTHAAYVW